MYFIIISYQVITGNYNNDVSGSEVIVIISYQVITGNYNTLQTNTRTVSIISYQVITGNYNIPSDTPYLSPIVPSR